MSLADHLRSIRLDLEGEAFRARMACAPAGVRLQLIGLLLQAEGLAREAAPVLDAERDRRLPRHLAPAG